MPQFPPDMFDTPPHDLQRVGAHRSPGQRGRGWVTFAWAALATGVLVAVGVAGVNASNGQAIDLGFGSTSDPSATPTPTVTPVTDPRTLPKGTDASVTVLNATNFTKLQSTASKQLKAAHWDVVSTADATANDVTETIVYYRSEKNAAIAAGVVEALGVGRAVYTKTVTFGAAIEVILGSDYHDAQ